jgi:beta-glucosidase
VKGENDLSREEIFDYEFCAEYFHTYITSMAEAIEKGSINVGAYTTWSLLDNFEWAEGYETRFGATFVDHLGGQKRYPKKSVHVFAPIFEELIKKE